ncbi:MAG: hypothetical protein CMQ24_16940, partial [Gammaproteobacteria bacterium]|nr:hypothetical protein [Gammaproteobacteria bacterium]
MASTIAGVLLGCESVTFPREGLVQLSAADHSAWIVVPEHLDVNRPTNLVILLHDAGSNGHRMLLRSGIDQHALASGYVAMAAIPWDIICGLNCPPQSIRMQETDRNSDASRSQLSARWQTDGQPSCCGVAGQGSDFSCCRPHLGLLGADPGCTVLVAATAL